MADARDVKDLPEYIRITMIFVDRVGFPILAFLLMFGLSGFVIVKTTRAIEDNTAVLRDVSRELGVQGRFTKESVRALIGTEAFREIEDDTRAAR